MLQRSDRHDPDFAGHPPHHVTMWIFARSLLPALAATILVAQDTQLSGLNAPVNINRAVPHEIGDAAAYNHAIDSLMLSELYGMSQTDRSASLGAPNQFLPVFQ